MKLVLLLPSIFWILSCKAQVQFTDVDSGSKKPILNLYSLLKNAPTDTARLTDTTGRSFKFYDEVVDAYFDKKKMFEIYKEFSYSGFLQYEVLHGMDMQIDKIRADSIFVMSGRYYSKNYGEVGRDQGQPGHFIAGVLKAGKPYAMLDIRLDTGGKFLYIAPIIHFE